MPKITIELPESGAPHVAGHDSPEAVKWFKERELEILIAWRSTALLNLPQPVVEPLVKLLDLGWLDELPQIVEPR